MCSSDLSEITTELTTTKKELITVRSDCRKTFFLSLYTVIVFYTNLEFRDPI